MKNNFLRHENTKSLLLVEKQINETPAVSIVIPTFKRPQLLAQSLQSAINQKTNIPYEIIVVDNDSDLYADDLVKAVVLGFNCSSLSLYRNEKNIGMFGNWNRCIELASAKWFTILNDDDLLSPDYIETAFYKIRDKSLIGVGIEYIGNRAVAEEKSRLRRFISTIRAASKPQHEEISLMAAFIHNPVPASLGVLLNKEAAVAIGGYDEDWWPSADYLFTLKYLCMFGGINLKKRSAQYRLEDNESFKIRTIIGFIKKNEALRFYVIESVSRDSARKKCLFFVSKIIKNMQAQICVKNYSLPENGKALFSELAIDPIGLPLYMQNMFISIVLIGLGFGKLNDLEALKLKMPEIPNDPFALHTHV